MAGESGGTVEDFSYVQEAKAESKSVKVTIPEEIASAAGIKKGDKLRWKFQRKTGIIEVSKA